MMRIGLFLLTNIAVLVVGSITLSFLGFNGFMAANGVDLNLQQLLLFCGVFGFGGAFVSLFLSKWMAKRAMGVQTIERAENHHQQWLMETVAHLSEKAGIKMPEVGIFHSESSNAFATGWNKDNALVAVSSGLLERFQQNEIEAVLGHEIGHVANGDMVTLTLIQGVVNTFVMFFARIIGHFVDRVVFRNEQGHGIAYFVTTIVAELILAFLASAIVAFFSRWREYRADEAGAHLTDRHSMASALRRLKAESDQASGMSGELVAFGIRSGIPSGIKAIFSTHPPLDDRIARLEATS